jgi:hypothetical protein
VCRRDVFDHRKCLVYRVSIQLLLDFIFLSQRQAASYEFNFEKRSISLKFWTQVCFDKVHFRGVFHVLRAGINESTWDFVSSAMFFEFDAEVS